MTPNVFFLLAALLLGLPARAGECPAAYARLTASEWETKYLKSATPETELEPQFKSAPMFYDMAADLTSYLGTTSFSNELPFELVSDVVNQGRAERMRNATLWELLKLKDEPILKKFSLTNAALCCRNVLTLLEQAPKFVMSEGERGRRWAEFIFRSRFKQLHNRPNLAYFDTFLSKDVDPSQLSSVGQWYQRLLPGKTFLDLASGDPRRAIANRIVAQRFGAADYVGVEMTHVPWRRSWQNEYPAISTDQGFTSRFIKNDILTFLRRLKRPGPLFIRLQGLESLDTDSAEKLGAQYMGNVMRELQRVTQPGDVFSIGRVVSFIQPQALGTSEYVRGPDYTIDPARFGFRLLEGTPHETPGGNADREYLWVRE